jgi:hypothetical protein
MSELTKGQLRSDNNSSFPNNNAQAITPTILRDYNGNIIDSLVDEITYQEDSGSWNQKISNINTGSLVESASFDNGTRTQTFTKADGSTFTNVIPEGGGSSDTGSLLVTASVVDATTTYTKGDGSVFTTTIDNVLNATSSSHAENADVVPYSGITDKPTLVSGSSQVSYPDLSNIPAGIVSGSVITSIVGGTDIGANTVSGVTTINNTMVTGSVARTNENNVFSGNQTFNDITVNGTGSFAYISSVTGSAKTIGDAFIQLNNDTPTLRYAGVKVLDSGSASPTTASIQYDGGTNDWFFEKQVGAAAELGVALAGPEYTIVGTPTYNASNKVLKGTGGHHIVDSNITDSGTEVTISTDTSVTGSISSKGDGTNAGKLKLFCEAIGAPHNVTLEGPSHSGGTAYNLKFPQAQSAGTQILEADSSGNLAWINTPTGSSVLGSPLTQDYVWRGNGSGVAVEVEQYLLDVNSAQTAQTAISASSVPYSGLTSVPSGIISGSVVDSIIAGTGISISGATGDVTITATGAGGGVPAGTVSGSSQIDITQTTNYGDVATQAGNNTFSGDNEFGTSGTTQNFNGTNNIPTIAGDVIVSDGGNGSTITVQGTGGGGNRATKMDVLNVSATNNGTDTAYLGGGFGSYFSVVNSLTNDEIGFVLKSQTYSGTGWTGPGISSNANNGYETVMGWQDQSTYTDNRTTFRTPAEFQDLVEIKKAVITNVTSVTPDGVNNIEIDFATTGIQEVTLGNGVTNSFTTNNVTAGQTINLKITQNATAASSVSFSSDFKQVDGSAYVPTADLGAVDILTLMTFTSTNDVYIVAVNKFV